MKKWIYSYLKIKCLYEKDSLSLISGKILITYNQFLSLHQES